MKPTYFTSPLSEYFLWRRAHQPITALDQLMIVRITCQPIRNKYFSWSCWKINPIIETVRGQLPHEVGLSCLAHRRFSRETWPVSLSSGLCSLSSVPEPPPGCLSVWRKLLVVTFAAGALSLISHVSFWLPLCSNPFQSGVHPAARPRKVLEFHILLLYGLFLLHRVRVSDGEN